MVEKNNHISKLNIGVTATHLKQIITTLRPSKIKSLNYLLMLLA